MEGDHTTQWLQIKYCPAPTVGHAAKRVKFSTIREQLETNFPAEVFTPHKVSALIKSAFPHTESGAAGKSRQKYIFGLEETEGTSGTHTMDADDDVYDQLAQEREEKRQLQAKVVSLEERIVQLEQESLYSPAQLSRELLVLLSPECASHHGPDTIVHFESFSVQTVIDEMLRFAPNLYGLLKSLGARASITNDGTQLEDVKVAMSLSILLKCRSVRVLGIQLFITLMLLARSTSRQVIKYI